jgi:hypothetical protein
MLILLTTVFSACSKKEDTASVSTPTSSLLVQGQWRVTYFNNNGGDSTAAYSSFAFIFTAGGSVAAFNNFFAINGTWSTYNDDSRNNLLLNFPLILSQISALNDDWHIIEKTSTKLRMQDVTAGGGMTHYLTLEKN